MLQIIDLNPCAGVCRRMLSLRGVSLIDEVYIGSACVRISCSAGGPRRDDGRDEEREPNAPERSIILYISFFHTDLCLPSFFPPSSLVRPVCTFHNCMPDTSPTAESYLIQSPWRSFYFLCFLEEDKKGGWMDSSRSHRRHRPIWTPGAKKRTFTMGCKEFFHLTC